MSGRKKRRDIYNLQIITDKKEIKEKKKGKINKRTMTYHDKKRE